MLSKNTHCLFRILSDKFKRLINEHEALSNLLTLTEAQLCHLFTEKNLDEHDTEELSLYMVWFMNQLLYVSVNDSKRLQTSQNIDLQKAIALCSYKRGRWWFNRQIQLYTSIIEQVVIWEAGKSIELVLPYNSPFEVHSDTFKSINAVFQNILISNKDQFNNIIHCCISLLTYATPYYCNLKKDLGIAARNTIFEVFRRNDLWYKNQALVFFSKHLEKIDIYTDQDTQFFLKVMHIMAIIFKDIPFWLINQRDHAALEAFKGPALRFFVKSPVNRMNFNDQQNVQKLVTYSCEIMFHQMKNCREIWFLCELPDLVTNMMTNVLDNFEYSLESVLNLQYLLEFKDPSLIMLNKYLVIAEIKAASTTTSNIQQISPTWKKNHERLMKEIGSLAVDARTETFMCISDRLLLAIQIEFSFTRIHQMQHRTTTDACFCSTLEPPPIQDRLMEFSDWNYKHVSLHLIDDLEGVTQKLINVIEKQTEINAEIVMVIVDIFTCILKLSSNLTFPDSMKQKLLAVIASPFYKTLKTNPQFNKLAAFQKAMILLPSKFKAFFEHSFIEPYLQKMRCNSLVSLAQLEVSKINNICWWLVQNIMQCVLFEANDELKVTLMSNFVSFIVNNSSKFQDCLDIYEKLRSDMKNGSAVVVSLDSILCLTGANVLIIKWAQSENAFTHFIICDDCELSTTIYKKDSHENELLRRIACLKDTKGVLISSDPFKNEQKRVQLNINAFFKQPVDFKIQLLPIVPSMINHSKEFTLWLDRDKGKVFFEGVFMNDHNMLQNLEPNLKDILCNIQKSKFSNEAKKEIFNNCFNQLAKIADFNAFGTDTKLQSLTVKMAFSFSTAVVDENTMIKCLKIFLLYVVQSNSQVMGEASVLALEMAKRNNVSLLQLFNWHKTFVMRHVVLLAISDFASKKSCLSNSFVNLTRRLDLPRMREFGPPMLDVICAVVLPMTVNSPKLMESLSELCTMLHQPLAQVLVENFLSIYQKIYTTQTPEILKKCVDCIEKTTQKKIEVHLTINRKKTVEQVLVHYHKSPAFVLHVMNIVINNKSTETDIIANDISDRFLGVLIYFEPLITSIESERVIKKNILLSLGDIIRFLGPNRITRFCFKIITVLKAAIEQKSMDLTETCMQVWEILIKNCDVTSLGPILSTIFVSLEVFIEKYPEEVNKIYLYLVESNNNLLSRNIKDLFFIQKTKASDEVKAIVLRHLQSQKLRDEANLRCNLSSLIASLNSENSHIKIRFYCLQNLKELFQKNREELNDLICGQVTMDPLIEELLHIMITNFKSTSNEQLQLATADCLGELGAIEPSLQLQNFANRTEFPKTIHSENFAKLALSTLCRSYQYKNGARYIDALSLAIQQILKERGVTLGNRLEHSVWEAIPVKMQPLMEPLLTSHYSPKNKEPPKDYPIFRIQAQTASEWTLRWGEALIDMIKDEDTKYFLECIKPSMKHNQQTTSLFMPYILLHCLEKGELSNHAEIRFEIQHVFDIVLGKIDSENNQSPLSKDVNLQCFNVRPTTHQANLSEKCINVEASKVAKLIFEMFDFLGNYQRKYPRSPTSNVIIEFLEGFDDEEMAKVNFECGEYARSMIYLEAQIKAMQKAGASPSDVETKLPSLAKIFLKLGNVDSVVGIQAMKTTEWSLEEKILLGNLTGHHQEMAACFEQMAQSGEAKFEHIQSIVNSYISLGQPNTALLVYDDIMQQLENTQQSQTCNELKAEPLWRMSRFEELEELLTDKSVQQSSNWGVRCGQLLLNCGSDENFIDELSNTRLAMMKNLKVSGCEQTAWAKNYGGIINLHLISDFEKAQSTLRQLLEMGTEKEKLVMVQSLFKDWKLRMEIVLKNVSVQEPIYCLHRIILGEMQKNLPNNAGTMSLLTAINDEIGRLWIKSTKLACKNKMYQQAEMYILYAEKYKPKELFLEKAKLHWMKNDQINAFKMLELGTNHLLKEKTVEELNKEDKIVYAEGKLMIARYNAEAINVDFETNKKLFKDASIPGAESEKLFLLTAEYMDRYYCKSDVKAVDKIAITGDPEKMADVMGAYYKSMRFGNEFVFQSMPRFLSIWLDTTAGNNAVKAIKNINFLVSKVVESLDAYYFYTAFSQLISRICHPSDDVFKLLKDILVKLIIAYPQQSLWLMIPMLKSSLPSRASKSKTVLQDSRLKDPRTLQLIHDFNSLIEKFMKLTTTQLESSVRSFSIDGVIPDLKTFLEKKRCNIIMPFQFNLQLIRFQNIFKLQDKFVYIHKIQDEAEVMVSLQKPKKVTLVGDDGKKYTMLFKNKDDVRIDLRFMEFTAVVKQFLHKDPEARQRLISTRTYSVVPLCENAGLIEWVPNLRTFKNIITSEYSQKNHKVKGMKEIQKIFEPKNVDKVKEFMKLVKLFYPALGDYYRQQFPTPQNYYNARLAFIRTTAVMSIIGYVVGLGDRHCENILFDVLSGESIHVDCNMLFNKGEGLGVPEIVPFRLTHNMIDAMGVLGIEGPFRTHCEIVLRVLQKEKSTLLSYLRPLVFDPLLNTSKTYDRKNPEWKEDSALKNIMKIENRLNGIVTKYLGSSEIPLSTKGQVNFIIGEATSVQNLAAMYTGWSPWM